MGGRERRLEATPGDLLNRPILTESVHKER